MTFYVLGEPTYQSSNWYKKIMEGLLETKRQKRFSLTILETLDNLKEYTITEDDAIFILGTNSAWLTQVIQMCELYFQNRVIVLGNHNNRMSAGTYSIVTSDIARDTQMLYTYLHSYGKNRIALYGINPESTSDAFRKESFLKCGAKESDIFYNNGSLSNCYHDFLQKSKNYDAVICANDYAAISLTRLSGNDSQIFITSCGGGLLLTRYFLPHITHICVDYKTFAKAGLDLCQILQKNKNISSVNVYLTSHLTVGDTTKKLPPLDGPLKEVNKIEKTHDAFYSDSELDEMLRLEMLLNKCDDADFCIITNLLDGMTYTQISDSIFMSVNGVKYKLKNMFQICRVSSKVEFVELLKKYLSVM